MARTIPFFLVNSFTTEPFAGNPAGVFFDCDDLSADTMRRLAGEIGLESAFVMTPTVADCLFQMRYFTAVTEIPYCGHATLAAATALVHSFRIHSEADFGIQTPAGRIGLLCTTTDRDSLKITMTQRPPVFGDPLAAATIGEVAAALGCSAGVITTTGLPVRTVSTGSPFLFVPVADEAYVDGAPADLAALANLSRRTDSHGVYVFTVTGDTVYSRNFCPLAGLNEDPVTGSASGALGGYLWAANRLPASRRFAIRQGYGGGRGGEVDVAVQASGDAVTAVLVTGTATVLASGAFALPETTFPTK